MQSLDKSVIKAHQENNVQMVMVTIDPARDTVARLHAYRSVAQITQPNWTLLTAAPADLTAMWKALGVDVEKTAEDNPPGIDWMTGAPLTYDVTHTDELFMLNKSGDERFLIDGAPNTQGVTPARGSRQVPRRPGPEQPRPPRRLNLDSRRRNDVARLGARQTPPQALTLSTHPPAPRAVRLCGLGCLCTPKIAYTGCQLSGTVALRTTSRWPNAKTFSATEPSRPCRHRRITRHGGESTCNSRASGTTTTPVGVVPCLGSGNRSGTRSFSTAGFLVAISCNGRLC